MKRVRVSPGKFVTVSTALADKAARIFASGAFTPTEVRDMGAAEPRLMGGGLLIGKPVRRPGSSGSVVVHGRDGRIVLQKTGSNGAGKRKAA
jgi:hypothetical protein